MMRVITTKLKTTQSDSLTYLRLLKETDSLGFDSNRNDTKVCTYIRYLYTYLLTDQTYKYFISLWVCNNCKGSVRQTAEPRRVPDDWTLQELKQIVNQDPLWDPWMQIFVHLCDPDCQLWVPESSGLSKAAYFIIQHIKKSIRMTWPTNIETYIGPGNAIRTFKIAFSLFRSSARTTFHRLAWWARVLYIHCPIALLYMYTWVLKIHVGLYICGDTGQYYCYMCVDVKSVCMPIICLICFHL